MMPRYVKLGEIPRKRHTQFRKPDGSLYAEQVFGTKGFSGIASILYHAHLPTEAADFAPIGETKIDLLPDEPLHHHHLKTWDVPVAGDPVGGRVTLLANDDVTMGLCRPAAPMDYFYKNADGDDLLFV